MPDEYISRDAAIEEIDKWLDTVGTALVGKGMSYYGELIGCIEDARTADVAEVVRCKDCKYYRNHPNGLCYLHTEPKENERGYSGEAVCVEPDDFCSYGERREE